MDIKFSTNNLAYQQGATEFLKLWRRTGEEFWFQRARALLHQGTQSTLTEEKRRWLNANYQGPANSFIRPFNPNTSFDSHCLGGGTEDVLACWPYKGNWTTKYTAILSMYMLAVGLDAGELLSEYGSITLDYERNWAGAIDTLDSVEVRHEDQKILLCARNMIDTQEEYTLKVIGFGGNKLIVDGVQYSRAELDAGFRSHSSRERKRWLRYAKRDERREISRGN